MSLLDRKSASVVCAPSQIGRGECDLTANLTKLGTMFKTFVFGILLGVAAAAAALYYVPVVDQEREQSLIVVHPNHGNTESFRVNVPMDRILIGAQGQARPEPVGLDWPMDEQFSGLRTELFKVRNAKDVVVGVASRISSNSDEREEIIEWVLHLPARGSFYVEMQPTAAEGGYRIGELRAGTRDFISLEGQVTERWVADTSGFEGAPAGRIELITVFVNQEAEL